MLANTFRRKQPNPKSCIREYSDRVTSPGWLDSDNNTPVGQALVNWFHLRAGLTEMIGSCGQFKNVSFATPLPEGSLAECCWLAMTCSLQFFNHQTCPHEPPTIPISWLSPGCCCFFSQVSAQVSCDSYILLSVSLNLRAVVCLVFSAFQQDSRSIVDFSVCSAFYLLFSSIQLSRV